jgi:4-alpha-glucanotransferase
MTQFRDQLGGQRQVGVLMHVTSLPGSGPHGCFNQAAHDWISLLARHQVGVWQVLPLAPPDSTGSPYSSPSGFAISPQLFDPDQPLPEWTESSRQSYRAWCQSQSFWLKDHCRFDVLRKRFVSSPWWLWPKPLASRERAALRQLDKQEAAAMELESQRQWWLQQQWQQLRSHAKTNGVRILGDLPFYGAHDSADVWSRPGLFSLNPDGSLAQQSGVPPDYFAATGQLWSTPVYRWNRHRLQGFRWWLQRLERQLELFDLLRLDHFRAFAALWSVPGSDATAEKGSWIDSPGWAILKRLQRRCGGSMPLVAEDLGVITPDVEALRDGFSLPGMKVLQFAFDGNPNNAYLPHNFVGTDWVAYTGTHDNATAVGWWQEQSNQVKDQLQAILGHSVQAPGWDLLRLALATTADLAVVPLQDLMSLDDSARFNRPGTSSGNWSWRLAGSLDQLEGHLQGLQNLAQVFGRGAADGFSAGAEPSSS